MYVYIYMYICVYMAMYKNLLYKPPTKSPTCAGMCAPPFFQDLKVPLEATPPPRILSNPMEKTIQNTMCAPAALAQHRHFSSSLAHLGRAPVRAPAQFRKRARFGLPLPSITLAYAKEWLSNQHNHVEIILKSC